MNNLDQKHSFRSGRLAVAAIAWLGALLLALAPATGQAQGAGTPAADAESVRPVIHILEYLGRDYADAVRDGQITNDFEYAEQQEFAAEAVRLSKETPLLSQDPEVFAGIGKLPDLVERKVPAGEIEALCKDLAGKIIARTGLATAPHRWPTLSRGAALFQSNCAMCHGATGAGDGPDAATMQPPPANLRDPGRMDPLAPFSMFNTIRLGIEGTAMAAHPDLSEEDVWDLAFYAASIRYNPPKLEEGVIEKIPPDLASLKSLALTSDQVLRQKLEGLGLPVEDTIAYLRTQASHEKQNGFVLARAHLKKARDLAAENKFDEATNAALSAYLEGIEPMEATLRLSAPEVVAEIESCMTSLREALREGAPISKIDSLIASCEETFEEGEHSLRSENLSGTAVFLGAGAIILREGLEAALIVVILLSVIRAWKAPQLKRQVHLGWIGALVAGVLTWVVSEKLLKIGGAQRENLEGIVSLLAVAVLLYVGFWLHRATQGAAWKKKIDEQARRYVEGGKGAGLFALSFLAVYREVFETVLFYRALWLEGGAGASVPLAAGFAAGGAGLAVVCIALFRFEARLPLKQVFSTSAGILAVLAVILAGKGIHSLQESGIVGVHFVSWMGRFELLGIYPTVEALLAQVATLGLVSALWWWGLRGEADKAVEVLEEEAAHLEENS